MVHKPGKNENESDSVLDMTGVSRRSFMAGLGAAASIPVFGAATVWAQDSPASLLPLNTPKIDHLDVIVPDVAKSARFYMGVFNTKLHAQPFQGGFRYFILLGEMPENRQVGYLAIGDSRGRGTYIGHFCTSIFNYRRDAAAISAALQAEVEKAGLGKLGTGGGGGARGADAAAAGAPAGGGRDGAAPGRGARAGAPGGGADAPAGAGRDGGAAAAGRGGARAGGGGGGGLGIFSDPDGIEIQFLPAPDTVVTAAVPSDLVEPNKGLVTPKGVDHVLLHVSDLERGARFYRIMYGKEATREQSPDRIWWQIGDTRLGIEKVAAGQKPRIEHFGIKVMPFDRAAVTAGLTKLGAKILPSPDEKDVLRFTDVDGITLELRVS